MLHLLWGKRRHYRNIFNKQNKYKNWHLEIFFTLKQKIKDVSKIFKMVCPLRFVDQLTITTSKVIFVLINTAVMMTSVLGNGIVMFVIITRQRLHQPTYYLIFSLALSDFLTALFGQSAYVTEVAFKKNTSCTIDRIITSLNGVSCSTSLMLICMISINRLLHMAMGLRYSENTSNEQVMKMSVVCLLFSLDVTISFCFELSYMQAV